MKQLLLLAILAIGLQLHAQKLNKNYLYGLLSHPEHAQGEMAGEASDTSIVLQSRLTIGTQKINQDVHGSPGWACFEISAHYNFAQSTKTQWQMALLEHDFIIKQKVDGLIPNTRYYYRLLYGINKNDYRTGERCSFRTTAGTHRNCRTSMVFVSSMNYDQFMRDPEKAAMGMDRYLGYPAAEAATQLRPDFFVGTGDNVSYDSKFLPFGRAVDAQGMRFCYHEQFYQQRLQELLSNVGTYWLKDDHDYRYNDCDNTGQRQPLPPLGKAMFREQLPVYDPTNPDALPFRTISMSADLQVWLLEGREYRSPNNMPDGSAKSLWGKEQRKWLKTTIQESTATFKIIISSTPLVGPDYADQSDNHLSKRGFYDEGSAFFEMLKAQGFQNRNLFVVCGDRNWQYHSIHPYGIEEFSCGAFCTAAAVQGVQPGNPKSTDRKGKIIQPYLMKEPKGGFLNIVVEPATETNKASISFVFYDEQGTELYKHLKKAW